MRNVNEGPRAGFLFVVANREDGFEDFKAVLELMTWGEISEQRMSDMIVLFEHVV